MKHLYQRKGWWYYVKTTAGKTTWTPLRTKDFKEADLLRAEIEKNGVVKLKSEGVGVLRYTLPQLCRDFLEANRARHAHKTGQTYQRALNALQRDFGDILVRDITRPLIVRYHATLADTPYEANLHLRVLCAALQFALDRGVIDKNPAFWLKKYKERKHTLTLTTDILFHRIYPEAGPELQRAIMLAFHLVQHENEVKHLKWSDFDMETSRVTFTRQKTGKVIVQDFSENQALKEYLDRIRSERRDLIPWVIHKDGQPFNSFGYLWNKALVAAGFKAGAFQFKEMRHLANTMLKEGGMSAGKRKEMTGHASERTNEIYTHSTGKETVEAGKILGRIKS